ncbi:DUF3019 domain-containing protein [Pseudoalteromonas sp. DL-6]|uniref:DUF3019 domain-containing protein n=1 Tax=Pseudoalteromonas sp. DL-6 TaxID=1390185 RepID=UPI00103D2B67|nr:DUF3019 domain-containing protein [Pseudoalteromonas sp. DL-6]QBJ61951.1 hypothetical protein B1F84_02315 [Pseudoalteromonas sp. DL-6]
MTFSFYKRNLNMLSTCHYSLLFMALTLSNQSIAQKLELQLQPRICVPEKQSPYCQQLVSISYPAELPTKTCLYLNKNTLLQCFAANQYIQFRFKTNTKKDIYFQLRDNEQNIIARKEFKVLHHEPPKRFRRGIGWNIL